MNKVDFAIIITAEKCNPNGDALTPNIPRQDINGYGEISDVCIKRKIRDRLFEMGESILVVKNDDVTDDLYSVKDRVRAVKELKTLKNDRDGYKRLCCETWIDVRAFGQVFPFKDLTGFSSIPIRGPVSLGIATSLDPVDIVAVNFTKSTNLTTDNLAAPVEKDSTTRQVKYIIDRGVYVAYGSISPHLASLTGFTEDDAAKIKSAISRLLENDESSARPSGSMTSTLIWAEHQRGIVACPAKVHRSFGIRSEDHYPYFKIDIKPIEGIDYDIISDF